MVVLFYFFLQKILFICSRHSDAKISTFAVWEFSAVSVGITLAIINCVSYDVIFILSLVLSFKRYRRLPI